MARLARNTLILGMALVILSGGAFAWFYSQSDELLRGEILRQAKKALPDLDVSMGRAHFDLRGRVHIFELRVQLPEQDDAALVIPETIITLDGKLLTEQQQFTVKTVRLSQPRLRVRRDVQGRYDWSGITAKFEDAGADLPDLEIAHGQVELSVDDPRTKSTVSFPIDDVNLIAKPSSRKSYAIDLSARSELTGPVAIKGDVPTEPAGWKIDAAFPKVSFDPHTLEAATLLVPELFPQLVRCQQLLRESCPEGVDPRLLPASPFDLGCTLAGRLNVHADQPDPAAAPTVRAMLELADGQLAHPFLPSPLFDLRGKVYADPKQISLREFTARNGHSRLGGAVDLQPGAVTAIVDLDGVPVDDALISRCPVSLQRIITSMGLKGNIGGHVEIRKQGAAAPRLDVDLQLTDGSVVYDRFPYPVRDVTGKLSWHENLIEMAGAGQAGGVPVKMLGSVRNPGPIGDAVFDLKADGVPFDDTFRQACPTALRKTIESLRLTGHGDVRARFMRPPGLNQKYQPYVLAHVHGATLQCSHFPYPISDCSGRIIWNGPEVQLQELRGSHDGAQLSGSGSLRLDPAPEHLLLEVLATNAAFDRSLHTALPPTLQRVWDDLSPQGTFDVRANVDWTVGQAVKIEVPQLDVLKADILLKNFPYPFQELQGRFAFKDNVVTLRNFQARHDDTKVSGEGEAICANDGSVVLNLNRLTVDDLLPTPALRRALPETLRNVIDLLNPSGRFSFDGPVKFVGDQRRDGLVAAEWDQEVVLAGCALNAGLRVDDIHGRVHFRGRWTLQTTQFSGEFDLDALDIFENHQFTQVRGPFRLEDGVLVVGSEDTAQPVRGDNVTRVRAEQRITGQAFGGTALLDAIVDLRGVEPAYQAHMELSGASLEKYALRHLRGYSAVRGLMNGWMDLRGRGLNARDLAGDGQLQISPAALYELPVFLQIFQLPQFQPINRSAFDYANFVFKLQNERFDFTTIDLVGNTISLRGRGQVRFDGAVNLDFYTMQPRNQVRVPGLREIVGVVGMVSQGWLAVEVRGPIAGPVARVVPFPAVDDALQQFLGAFEPRPVGPAPRASNANPSQQRR